MLQFLPWGVGGGKTKLFRQPPQYLFIRFIMQACQVMTRAGDKYV